MPTDYRTTWENFWRDLGGGTGEALWDCPPEEGAAYDLPRMELYFDPALPLIDVGCGNGRQTEWLARHMTRVIGLDVAPAALAAARQHHGAPNLEYRELDLLDADAVRALHAEVGDANVYIRAVLHPLAPRDWAAAVASLSLLVGARGHLFFLDLAPGARAEFEALIAELGSPPPKLAQLLAHGIQPAAVREGEMHRLLTAVGLEVRATGPTHLRTTEKHRSGEQVCLTAEWWVLARPPG